MKNKKLFFVKCLLILETIIIVVLIMFLFARDEGENKKTLNRDKNSHFLFTNPILDCEDIVPGQLNYFSSKEINEEMEQVKKQYQLSELSMYFRDLNNGQWLGFNEKEYFSPASLLKVPIFIAFLNQAENDKNIFNKEIIVTENDINKNLTPNIIPKNNLVPGQKISLFEVSKYMIQESDNTATKIMLNNIKSNAIADVFYSVGVPFKDLQTEAPVRVKDYAGFFRILFNSSYLSREMSETALKIMSEIDYDGGIRSGIPYNIKVSHKFGERSLNNEIFQLHDCGIVYYPDNPYILCIMTRGKNIELQNNAITDISKYIYQKINMNI